MTGVCYILKVSSLYEVLKGEVESSTGTQKQTEDKIAILKDQLGKITEDLQSFDTKLGDIERQQHKLAKQQEAFGIETKQAIYEVKEKQVQTAEKLDKLTNTYAHKYRTPLDEGKTDISSFHFNCVERETNIEMNTIGTILLECVFKNKSIQSIDANFKIKTQTIFVKKAFRHYRSLNLWREGDKTWQPPKER